IAKGVRLDGAVCSRMRLPGADLEGASLTGAKLDGADLAGANLTDANLTGADLTGANLAGVNLTGAVLEGAVLAEASLEDVDLAGLDLSNVDLTGLDADLLGLSEEQRDAVVAIGIPVNPDARLKPKEVAGGRSGDLVVAVWENDDGEGLTTLRWMACTPGKVTHGILPVTPQSVLDRGCIGTTKGVEIVLHRERPGGITLDTYRVDPEGRLADTTSTPLGYPPMVSPVMVPEGEGFMLYGLARRGPTLVVSGPTPEGFAVRASKPLTTARGFLGRHQPFLACKGNVLMPCTRSGVGKPYRSPDGFPGKLATVASDGERWLAVWVDPPAGKEKGGIRAAWLVDRGSPEVMPVTANGAVLSLDLAPSGEAVWLAWVELEGLGETRLYVQEVGTPKPRQLPIEDVDAVQFVRDPAGDLQLLLTTDDERLRVVDLAGRKLGELTD
ncbi:MAG: pentapeptide repeat-containing protein, partial [Myxococcales bacterium]|nr:pentapeptide repeat-containing protein [Myxococcales bacterium]